MLPDPDTDVTVPGDVLPYRYATDATAAGIRATHPDLAPDTVTGHRVRVAGRLTAVRRQGALTFARLGDRTGEIQLFVDTAVIGAGDHGRFDTCDRGDWVGVEGRVMTTRRGELSVRVESFALLGRAVAGQPDKRHGLTDVETRYRQRYADLAANARTREIFRIRHTAIRAVRRHLEEQGFTEVEGPVLQTIQGGAAARPFVTHHNALDVDLYLRIALELHLKRLVVGGMERVFEIGRVFRNEGLDARHNPEFTMLEAYQAFADYHDMIDLTEGLVARAVRDTLGGDTTVRFGGHEISLATPFPRRRFADMIAEHTGAVLHPAMPLDDARCVLDRLHVPYQRGWGAGRLMKEVYDAKVQAHVVDPVFCLDYPREVSPLARVHREDPAYVERFELIVAGFELCNAYSEQNDPAAQLAAFEAEARAKAGGDPEAGDVDLDYVRALEHGMPCTGGLGIGLDRLVMLLAGVESIREVILFPTLRPEFAPPPGCGPGGAPRPVLPPTPAPVADTPAAVPDTPAGPPDPAPGPATSGTGRPARSRMLVRTLAALTALGGVLQLLTLLPVVHERLAGVVVELGPLWFRVAGRVVSVIVGLLLLQLADQLAKRKRAAWRVATVLFVVDAVAHVIKGPHPVAAAFSVGMAVALLLSGHEFHAPVDPPSLLRLARFVPVYLGAVFAFGLTSLYLGRRALSSELTFGGAVETVLSGLVGLDGPYSYQRRFFAEFIPDTLLALGITGLVVLVWLLYRPLRARGPHTAAEWERAADLVHRHGWDTLAYFALRDDKSFFFGSDGEAMLAYTYLGGYALVSGDPIGPPGSVPRLLDEFLAMCDGRAWNPAFLAVRESDMPLYAARGFRDLYLGDEAIVRCDRFTLDGPARKTLRSAVRRVGRRYTFQLVTESNAPAPLVESLNAISARWRGKSPERGFTMSLSQDVRGAGGNPDFLLCVAVDDEGRPGGFLRLVPAYGEDFGYTLDLMRHDPDAPNGMTEFLVASTAAALRERGVVRLSMNFAVWGRLFAEDIPFTWSQRLARRAVSMLNPFFQIRSLREFNAKFDPDWLPRVLAFRRPTDLARVGLLYAGAEGFLALPVIGELLVPKAVGGVASPSAPDRPAPSGPPDGAAAA